MDANQSGPNQGKNPIETLSKDELISKYKGLLQIAKKAKQVKDELAEENRFLKDNLSHNETQKVADKKALLAMKEMIEEFTKNKLQLATQLSELQQKSKQNDEALVKLLTENESLKRQIKSKEDDNESLLQDIDCMDQQLKQVNVLGIEQKKHLTLLELEVNKLKEAESENRNLQDEVSKVHDENKTIKEQLNETTKSLSELQEKYNNVKEINSEQRRKFNGLKERFLDVHRRLKQLKECKRILLETQYEYSESVSNWQAEIIKASQALCSQMNALKSDNQILTEKLLRQQGNSGAQNNSIKEFADIYLKRVKELRQLVDRVSQESQEGLNNKTKLLDINLENENLRKELQEMNCLLQENKDLRDELLQTRSILETLENEKVELYNHDAFEKKNSTDEHDDTLEEMRTQLILYKQTIEELELRYANKEREHADLLAEMRELNDALKARGDVISRQQVTQKELQNEITQANYKLGEIQEELKLKTKEINEKDMQINDISREIESERRKILESEKLHSETEAKVRLLTQELQQLRQSDAQSDILSVTTEDPNTRLRDVEDGFEEKYNKLLAVASKLKKKLQEKESYVAELEKQRSSNEELEEILKKDNECLKLELEKHKKQLESRKQELQKLQSSRKQANVLNLEIEAAEKSLSEVTTKLASKMKETETLQDTLQSKEQKIVQLRKEIKILEEAKAAECIHSKELKEQIDRLQTQIKDSLHSKQQVLEINNDLEQARYRLTLELEDLHLQMARMAGNKEAELAAATAKTQQVEQQYAELQAKYTSMQAVLKSTERQLEDLRVEFLEYKVKAQAVLRKNQSRDSEKEREQEEELLALRATEKELQINLDLYEKKLDEKERELKIMQEDNVSLQRRSRELMNLVDELRQQNDSMAQEQRQQLQQQQAALKQQRLQIEQLDTCHKEQIQQLESSFQKQLEVLKSENIQSQRQPITVGATALTNSAQLPSNEQSKIDFLLMEREDAEGSEEAAEALAHIAAHRKISSTSSRRSHHDFMPLDELLSSPMNIISDTVTTITALTSDDEKSKLAENRHMELQATKEILQKQESRIRHLTALLAENEQDLAKLTQMNDMLKEELRRQERAVERQEHMHNSEYLKNIIIKFLTLNNGDEKTRLVPVLNTILKLSRSEMEMLACVAKGQKITADSNSRSWGNFLPSWGNNSNQ